VVPIFGKLSVLVNYVSVIRYLLQIKVSNHAPLFTIYVLGLNYVFRYYYVFVTLFLFQKEIVRCVNLVWPQDAKLCVS